LSSGSLNRVQLAGTSCPDKGSNFGKNYAQASIAGAIEKKLISLMSA